MMVDEHLIGLQPGTIIAGRYEVVKCLGAGSMGLVYACRHRELTGHILAVKVLFPEVAQDKVAAARFRNEIFASYNVSHPNVVRAYDYIRDGDLVAYTMEYVSGGDLADLLGDPDQLIPISEVISILMQMCSGVQAIHDAGIVHRDLKPENILLTKERVVKIGDFGIARLGHGPRLTEHGGVVGTIDYVSPEYILKSQVDWRSDIYAMGILAYEMLTGGSPYPSDESVYATMTNRLKSDPVAPSLLRRGCCERLDQIVLKAMARDPEKRYQSAAEMYYDLRELAGDSAVSAEYLSISESSSAKYIGPKLHSSAGIAALESSDLHLQSPDRQVEMSRVESRAADQRQYRSDRDETADPLVETYVLDTPCSPTNRPGEQQAASEAGTSQTGAVRLATWDDDSFGPAIQIAGGALSHNRLQRLSKVVQRNHRSLALDLLTLVFAIILGAGLGVAALNLFWPDLLAENHYLAGIDGLLERIAFWR